MAKKTARGAKPVANGKPQVKRKPTTATGTKVYSYIRFSTPEQAEGDSERRQIEAAKNWAAKHGHTFDESLRDEGRSGWTGAHRKKGNLGRFLERVENGEVPRGSILVVEELRRLTREGLFVGLKEIFEKLWDAGIAIQTLTPEFTYTREECENNIGTSVALTILLQLAKEESEQKSRWLKAANEKKRRDARDKGTLFTNMAPSWLEYETPQTEDAPRKLRLNKNGKAIANKAAAKAIQAMFRMKGQGRTDAAIARETKSIWSNGKVISASYVAKILGDRRVLGEYQPHRKVNGKRVPEGDHIDNYFPKIVDVGLFNRVQQKLKRGCKNMGRKGQALNVLHNLCRCGYCGGPMHFHLGVQHYSYLICGHARTGLAECLTPTPAMKYREVEQAVLEQCRRLRPEQVLPNKSDKQQHIESLSDRINETTATLEANQERINNLNEQIETTKDAKRRNYYDGRIVELEKKRLPLESNLDKLRNELVAAQQDEKTFTAWQANIEALTKALENKDDVQLRERLNGHLHDFIEKVELFSHGYKDADADDFDSYLHESQAEPWVGNETDGNAEYQLEFRSERMRTEFVKWAMAKRHTKAGRFIRIHYRHSPPQVKRLKDLLGADEPLYFDVVPEGSIAGETSIGSLLEQFSKTRKIPACAQFVKV